MVDPFMHPVYTQVPGKDTTVIGVSHVTDINSSNTEKLKFKGVIKRADHLIFEAQRDTMGYAKDQGSNCYELFAFTLKREQSHFLENPAMIVDACAKNGMPAHLAHLYNTVAMIVTNCDGIMSSESIEYMLSARAKICSNFVGDLVPTTRANLQKIAGFAAIDPDLPYKLGKYVEFSAKIRDYEVLGPGVTSLVNSLQGSKAVIIGEAHRDYIARYIAGEKMSPPLTWPEFLDNLPESSRRDFSFVESML